MSRAVRLFLILLVVALPPLLVLGVLEGLGEALVGRIGQGTTLLIVALVAVLWAGIVTLVASRSMAGEVRALIDLAERGTASGEPEVEAGTEPFRRLNAVMDERNRQLAELVEHLRSAPISEDAGLVARAMVAAARSVTNNPTWTLAVLGSDEPTLRPAVYSADHDSTSVTEMHRWAASAGEDPTRPRLIEGPWGQFVAVPVGAGSRLVALLLAPWEGRAAPSTAEINLLSLLGEHAAAAIEHALLYGALRTRTDQLNRMAAIQTDFLRGVTHDLQTPLTSIRALADELQHQDEIDTAARIDLQTIAYQADRLRRMVAQLLVMSRLEVGAVTPRQEVFRLEPLIERTWSALRAVDRTFELRIAGAAFLVVADPDRLEQVMWALLDNAVKYSPVGSRIEVDVSSRAALEGELTAEVRVTDRGVGMDDETMEHAFEQFYRAKSARTQAPDGSGVGLYASRGLIEAMGGTIRIGRASGGGTTVSFSLPAEPVDEQAQPAAEALT
jgi:signal transduction histidine kinase/predicted transcriptional regulator